MAILGSIFLLQVILMAIYFNIEAHAGFSTMGVLGLFLLQQVFSFVRVQLRQVMYSVISY